MGRGRRANLERLLRSAWEYQTILRNRPTPSQKFDPNAMLRLVGLIVSSGFLVIGGRWAVIVACPLMLIFSSWFFILLLRAKWHNRALETATIISLAVIISAAGWYRWPPPPFNAIGELVGDGKPPYGLGLWTFSSGEVHPVGIQMYIRVRSNNASSEMVDSIEVEIKTDSGTWEDLIPMDVGKLFAGTYPSLCAIETNLLDSEMVGKNLQTGVYVSGWKFFDFPKSAQVAPPDFSHYVKPDPHIAYVNPGYAIVFQAGTVQWSPAPPYEPKFRVKVKTLDGATFTAPLTFAESRWSHQPLTWAMRGIPIDFSSYPITLWRTR
jgi:hypothetical protein